MAITRFPIETTEAKVEVTLPVGRHTLQLVVEDSAGLRSAPATVVIEVKKIVRPTPTVTITTPTITRPTLTTPTITRPTITITEPTLTIPTLTRPTITIPTLTEPTVTIPTVTRPTITIPTLTSPTVTIPTLTRPTVTIPTLTRPTVTRPTMTVPTLPSMIVPGPSVITRGTTVPTTTPLASVKGVDEEAAGKLSEAGIADAETLAKSTIEKVASALGIENTKARTLISEAKKTVK